MPTRRSRHPLLALPLSLCALALGIAGADAATPIDLGPAKNGPRLATAESGAGHLTWAGADEALHYCRLDPGAGSCSAAKTFPSLAGNEPYDLGNAPLLAPDRLLILDVREKPDDYKLLYTSSDGFNAPTTVSGSSIGELMGITDAVFAPAGTVNAKERILTVQSGPVSPNGGKFQAVGTAGGETTSASFSLSNGDETCAESVARVGALVYGAFINCGVVNSQKVYLRRYQGDGALANLNDKTKWTAPGPVGEGYSNVVLAGGPSGLYIAYDRLGDRAVVLRKFVAPASWTEPVVLGVPDVHSGFFALSEDSVGVLHFSWEQGGNLLYRYGRDATNESFTNPQTLAGGGDFDEQRIGVNAAGNGWISWNNFANERAMALPLSPGEPQAEPSSPGGANPQPAGSTPSSPSSPSIPRSYTGPTKTREATLGQGLTAGLTTPKSCVAGGQRFKARLAVKRKGSQAHKAGYSVKKVKFLLDGKLVSTDTSKPFEVSFTTSGAPVGATLTVAAKVTVKLRQGKRRATVGKILRAPVKTCG